MILCKYLKITGVKSLGLIEVLDLALQTCQRFVVVILI